MKTSMQVYGKAFDDKHFSDEQLELLHQRLFEILEDVKKVCDKYNIKFMLGGGTALGAVRHQGFIPWDDDLDIMMFRKDYMKFRKVFIEEFPEKYYLAEPLDKDYTNKKPKIFYNNTVYKEVVYAGLPDKFQKVFIDVFLLEYLPNAKIARQFIGFFYDCFFQAASFAADYKYPSPVIMERCENNKELKWYYYSRRAMGFLFSIFFGMRFYLKLTEKLSHSRHITRWVGTPAARGYNRNVYPSEMFDNTVKILFCNDYFDVPYDYDRYLTMTYGDYMKLPKEEDRRVHAAAYFEA